MLLTTDFLLSLFQVINGYIKKKIIFLERLLRKEQKRSLHKTKFKPRVREIYLLFQKK